MSEIEVIEAMARAWGRWQQEPGFPFGPDHCINGTRVVTRALQRFDIRSQPVSVRMIFFNAAAYELWLNDVPITDWPDFAWSVGVGPGAVKGEGHWDGHLCAEGANWTLDISAAQFNRPGRIVSLGPRIMPKLPALRDLLLEDDYGQKLLIGRWPANNGWRSAGGWLRLHGTEVRELVERTNRLLMKGTA